mmetsp:Transcript_20758/g.44944  ORF Transcript_20758/g.44944 Transcript_20758/m.44944 type:complete len:533 (-) Transcript_20758:91-1689(-)
MDTRKGMEHLDGRIFVVGGFSIHITQNGGESSSQSIVQKHLLDGTIKQGVDRLDIDTGGQVIDKLASAFKLLGNVPRNRHVSANLFHLGNVIGLTVHRGNGNVFPRFKGNASERGKGTARLGPAVLRVGQDFFHRTGHESTGHIQGGILSKDLGSIVDNGEQTGLNIVVFNETEAVVSGFFNLDLGAVRSFGAQLVKGLGQGIIGVVDTHPTFQGTSHILQSPIDQSTVGFHARQTVQGFQGQIGRSQVGKGGTTDQGGKVFFGQNVVLDIGLQFRSAVNFFNFHLVGAHVKDALGLVVVFRQVVRGQVARRGARKGFDLEGRSVVAGSAHKGTESQEAGGLVGFVGGVEFQNGSFLGFCSKRGHTLSSIDVKGPDGLSKVSSDTGQKGSPGGLGVVILQHVALSVIKERQRSILLDHDGRSIFHGIVDNGLGVIPKMMMQSDHAGDHHHESNANGKVQSGPPRLFGTTAAIGGVGITNGLVFRAASGAVLLIRRHVDDVDAGVSLVVVCCRSLCRGLCRARCRQSISQTSS